MPQRVRWGERKLPYTAMPPVRGLARGICVLLAFSLIIGISSNFYHISIICFSCRDCKFFSLFLAFCENKTYNEVWT